MTLRSVLDLAGVSLADEMLTSPNVLYRAGGPLLPAPVLRMTGLELTVEVRREAARC